MRGLALRSGSLHGLAIVSPVVLTEEIELFSKFSVVVELLLDSGVIFVDWGNFLFKVLGDLGGTRGGAPSLDSGSDGRYASAGSMHSSFDGMNKGARPRGRRSDDALRIDFPLSGSTLLSRSSSSSLPRFGSLVIARGVSKFGSVARNVATARGVRLPLVLLIGVSCLLCSGDVVFVGGRPGMVAVKVSLK